MANTAPAKPTTTITPFEEVKRYMLADETKAQFAMALPPQMPPEKFLRVAITACNKSPEILECDRRTLYQAFMLAAQDGLLPDGREAAIVPFGKNATYMSMVGGILKKVRNSGELKSIVANIVREGDEFRYWVDEDGEHLKHEPTLEDEDKRKVLRVYALAKTKDDGVYITVMSHGEVEAIRNNSKAKNAGPWTQHWNEMAKKTAIRRLAKRLPMSTDLEDFFHRDDERTVDLGGQTSTPSTSSKGGPTRLEKMLGQPGKVIEGESRTIDQEPPPPAAEETKPEEK
jgi:phage RecT family recombinase